MNQLAEMPSRFVWNQVKETAIQIAAGMNLEGGGFVYECSQGPLAGKDDGLIIAKRAMLPGGRTGALILFAYHSNTITVHPQADRLRSNL